MNRKVLPVIVLVVLALCAGLTGGVALDRVAQVSAASARAGAAAAGPNIPLIQQAWDTLQRYYVDRQALQSTQVTYGAIGGMVDALGDTGHSRFLTPQMVKEESNFTAGKFEGVGVEVQSKDGNVVIVAPIDGSPAQKAGLKPGDIIVKVDGKDVTQLPLSQVAPLILGPAGTKVTLTIMDPQTGATRDVPLTRASIALQAVTWQQLPGTTVAHLRIAEFSNGVTKDLEAALQDMQKKGITAVILDLRRDPGGLLNEAVGAASEFLPSGNVLEEKDAQGNLKSDPVKPGGVATNMPVAVLIDQGTASAAEIVASALQDAHRAQVIGETSFGTGTVLQQYDLADGSALLIATKEWLTRDGRVLWRHGVAPDTTAVLPTNVTPLVPEMERTMTATDLQNSTDTQLLKALESLTGKGQVTARTR